MGEFYFAIYKKHFQKITYQSGALTANLPPDHL